MKRLFIIILLACVYIPVFAQEITVVDIQELTTDLEARTRPRTDLNGEPCALVKVAMPTIDDLDFKGNTVGTVVYRMGVYNVYVTAGTKRLTYQHEHYYPGVIDFEAAGITVSPSTTYSVTLKEVGTNEKLVEPEEEPVAMMTEPEMAAPREEVLAVSPEPIQTAIAPTAPLKLPEFVPRWYIMLRGGVGETIGNTYWTDLLSPAADLSLGYQFTPVFGLRGNILSGQGKGAAHYGIPAETVVYKFNFAQLALDATFDILNIFKTNVERVLSPYVYAGIGANMRFGNDEALSIAAKGAQFEYLWDGTKFSHALRIGLGFDIRLSNAIKLNTEVSRNFLSDKFNSKWNLHAFSLDFDNQFTALIGIKYSFDKKSVRHQ